MNFDNFLLGFLVFVVLLIPGVVVMAGAFWLYDFLTDGFRYGTPEYNARHRAGTRAGVAILTAGGGLLLIFCVWSVALLNNSQQIARVSNQMKLEKHQAIDNCLSEKFGVRHFLFNTYYNEETGETGTISQKTFDTCKGAF